MVESMEKPLVNRRPNWDVHNPHSRLGQLWVATVRKIYHPIGFHKGYNFPLFLIGVGGMMGFAISRMYLFDLEGNYMPNSVPGEWYYYRAGYYRIGFILHLVGVLPGGFLASLQFIPIIRYKALLFHRLNGYVAMTLLVIGVAGALMIVPRAQGGEMSLRLWAGFVGTMLFVGMILAYVNIKRLQIDQHRAWMLRVWTWAASIASLRIILIAAIYVCTKYGYTYHVAIRCSEVFFMYQQYGVPDEGNPTGQLYPQCAMELGPDGLPTGNPADPATNSMAFASVANLGSGPENAAGMARSAFSMASWLALLLHALAIETYLWLTPAESYRLRTVSYERQVERGWRKRGSRKDAGITNTRVGDAPEWWSVPMHDYIEQRQLEDTVTEYDNMKPEQVGFGHEREMSNGSGSGLEGSRHQDRTH